MPAGSSSFEFRDSRGNPARAIQVHGYRPAACDAACPVWLVMHGVKRNGDEYRDQWIPLAEKHKFLVFAPTFAQADWPGAAAYSQGNTAAEPDPEKWAFSAIEHLFDALKQRYGLASPHYRLFGHSAGGQFVHRFLLFRPGHRAEQVVAANSGAYTMPVWDSASGAAPYPYSLVDARVGAAELKAALGRPFTLMLGEADVDPKHPALDRSPAALQQGLHRHARGKAFFAAAQAAARRLDVPFNWKLVSVPQVGHDGENMARALFGEPLLPRGRLSDASPINRD